MEKSLFDLSSFLKAGTKLRLSPAE